MAVSRGSCRGQALRRRHTLHPVSPISRPMCTHTLVRLQRVKRQSVAVNLVSSRPFGFAARDELHWDIFLPLPKHLRRGWERSESIRFDTTTKPIKTAIQRAKLLVALQVRSAFPINAFWEEEGAETPPPQTRAAIQILLFASFFGENHFLNGGGGGLLT